MEFKTSASAADRARRQLFIGSGGVTLCGQRLPRPGGDVRLGRRGRDAVRRGRTAHDDGEDTQDQVRRHTGAQRPARYRRDGVKRWESGRGAAPLR